MANHRNYEFSPPPELVESPRGRRLLQPDQGSIVEPRTGWPGSADVAIVGGGLAAIAMSSRLWHSGISDFVIIDPHQRLGQQFTERADAIGQRTMRSPYEHHVGCHFVDDCELVDFGRLCWPRLTSIEQEQVALALAGHRSIVPLDVFEAHLAHTVRIHNLENAHVVDTVASVDKLGSGEFRVTGVNGSVRTRRVILAVGDTVIRSNVQDARILDWDQLDRQRRVDGQVAVIGGGHTAATVTNKLLQEGCRVTLYHPRADLNFRCADVPADYFRPAGRHGTNGVSDPWHAAGLREASIMLEYRDILHHAERQGSLKIVPNARLINDGKGARIRQGEELLRLPHDYIIPCLGMMGADAFRLNVETREMASDCSITDGIFAMGRPAMAAVGLSAKNIDGHRVQVSRISDAIR